MACNVHEHNQQIFDHIQVYHVKSIELYKTYINFQYVTVSPYFVLRAIR